MYAYYCTCIDPLIPFSSVRQWILDAIPAIGTPAALKFIKEKFMVEEMTVAEAAQALIASIQMVTADTEAIRLVQVGKRNITTSSIHPKTGEVAHFSLLLTRRPWQLTKSLWKTQLCVRSSSLAGVP